jgi:hypothetical protein
MEPERAADGGWEAAIDPSLAARLLRPAVRPGLSDPAHGRTLAARLKCATAPTLADDLARRYGSTALGGNRPPVVYAAPPAPPAPAAGIDPGDDGVPRDPSSARAAPAGAEMDAGRPIVRAAERTSGPAFPPVRSAGAGAAVQRRLDPVAAAVPVVAARRAGVEPPRGTAELPAGSAGTVPATARPVVSPAPTRLRRQLAAEHAEAAPSSAAPVLRVRAAPASRDGGDGGAQADVTIRSASHPVEIAPAGPLSPERTAPSAAPGAVSAAPAPALPDVVQRTAVPAAPPVPALAERTAGDGMAVASSPSLPGREGGTTQPGETVDSVHPANLPVVSAAAGLARSADGIDVAQGVRAPIVQRSIIPESGDGAADDGGGSPGGRTVVAGQGTSAAVQRVALPVAAAAAGGGGALAGSRPVVSARGTAVVQRAALLAASGAAAAGTATRLVHAVPVLARGAESVQRREASTTPPPGAPPAEMPTATAPGAPAGGGDTARLAEQVYGILVRRLESERKQRGW